MFKQLFIQLLQPTILSYILGIPYILFLSFSQLLLSTFHCCFITKNPYKYLYLLIQQQLNSYFHTPYSMNHHMSETTDTDSCVTSVQAYRKSTFQVFLKRLSLKNLGDLEYQYSNKFVRFKKSDYMSTIQVIDYYRNVFQMKTNTKKRRKWHMKDKFVLFWVVTKHCELSALHEYKLTHDDWQDVASVIGLSRRFVMRKWICLLRHTTEHFQWSKSEQNTLVKYMAKSEFYMKWTQLSLKIFQESDSTIMRTCKDIRQRWKNYLDPSLKKSQWSQEEDKKLLRFVQMEGKKWSAISKLIQGRTQNQVKNRFITLSKKNKILLEIDDEQQPAKEHSEQMNGNKDSPQDNNVVLNVKLGEQNFDEEIEQNEQVEDEQVIQENFIDEVLKDYSRVYFNFGKNDINDYD